MLDRFPHSGKGFFPHHRDMVRFGPGEGTQGQQVIQDSWGSLHAAELVQSWHCLGHSVPGMGTLEVLADRDGPVSPT